MRKTLRRADGATRGIGVLLEARIRIEGVLVDLLKLASVRLLARRLLRRGQRLDAVVWNAGITGWRGLNWPRAVWDVCTDLVHGTTYPRYPIVQVGLRAKAQFQGDGGGQGKREPELGQVFTANVFGHYLLTHWLAPLLHAESRVVWISSISALADAFRDDDVQALRSPAPYEASKRLTDLLVLTSELPSTQPSVQRFLPGPSASRPRMLLTHPGVVGTSIAGLHWLLELCMFAAMYLSRWLGSPWHPVEPYKGAVSAVFAVLGSLPERREGKGKWGAATTVFGDERVARTEVEGWGFCGEVGVVPAGSVTRKKGQCRGPRETTREAREEFEESGRVVWREMERMREEWEGLLGAIEDER